VAGRRAGTWRAPRRQQAGTTAQSGDEAIKIAAGHPVAALGAIEVRPFYGG
jgi:hypothetical protein